MGLDNVTSIGGFLEIEYNIALISLTGLENVISIGSFLFIRGNKALISLTGLNNVTSIGGPLYIFYNTSLTSLNGLDNVASIGGYLEVRLNSVLTSLSALNGLTSVGGSLDIRYNNALTSLTGLENITANSINNLVIKFNDSLSFCEVQSICDYLASPSGTIDIQNNAYGCNSQQQVEAACAVVSLDEVSTGNTFSIYPNPTSSHITIETPSIGHLTILNLNGQEIITRQITGPKTQLDISNLPGGVYFVRLTNDRTVTVGKIIKQ
jgi:hypothetical protein